MKLKNNSLNYPSPSRHDYSLENGIMAKRGIDTTIQRYKEREVTARRSIGKKSIHHLLPSPTGDECFQIFGQCIEPVFQSENNKDR